MGIDRRRFLQLGALAVAMRGGRVAAAGGRIQPKTRFEEIRLRTARPIDEMEQFYAGVLGLKVLERTRRRLMIAAGDTRLTYVRDVEPGAAPFYHVAFNIPRNKVLSARDWQLERTPLDPNPNAERDPDHPDLVYFSRWDAHAVFFRDPAGNILEHIARHTLDNAAPGPFSSRDILCCSEIALVLDADDLRPEADRIAAKIGAARYRNSSPFFVALGDENGLVLVMKKGSSLRGDADIYPTEVDLRGPQPFDHALPGLPYRLRTSV
ncbi:MAG: glyoxalase/bleomycin resistance/dioxygenase family protein [Acidobacteriota bacterium]